MLYAIHFSLRLGYIAGMQCVVLCQMAGLASAKLHSGHLTTTFQEAMHHFFLRLNSGREMAAKTYSAVFSWVRSVATSWQQPVITSAPKYIKKSQSFRKV